MHDKRSSDGSGETEPLALKIQEIMDAVAKRAKGYAATETVEEYAVVDGSLELVKRKVTVKDVPPDMTAAKILIDGGDVETLTDEQLALEKRRLLEELAADERRKSQAQKLTEGI